MRQSLHTANNFKCPEECPNDRENRPEYAHLQQLLIDDRIKEHNLSKNQSRYNIDLFEFLHKQTSLQNCFKIFLTNVCSREIN